MSSIQLEAVQNEMKWVNPIEKASSTAAWHTVHCTHQGTCFTILHKLRELSHLSGLIKIALATKAVSLHWPVLPSQWRSVDSVEARMLGLSQETKNWHKIP